MIANKLLQSYYMIGLTGDAAKLEFIFGKDFRIMGVEINSLDFRSDVDAAHEGRQALEFFLNGAEVKSSDFQLNPEFFPHVPEIQLTELQRRTNEDALVAAQDMATETQIPLVLTRNFDDLGDFVSSRLDVSGDNFTASMKVVMDPEQYLSEKGKSAEEQLTRSLGPHREVCSHHSMH